MIISEHESQSKFYTNLSTKWMQEEVEYVTTIIRENSQNVFKMIVYGKT